jgi:hypothetical protein
LDTFKAASVIDGKEANGARITVCTDPSLDDDFAKGGEVFPLGMASIELGY